MPYGIDTSNFQILQELVENLPEENLIEFTYAIRDSEIASELVILSQSLDLDDDATPEDHLITTKTVTDSVKKQIEMYIKKKWISNILHTINEVISIIKGVG